MLEVGEYVRHEGIITKAIDKVGLYAFELDNGTFYDPRDITYEGIKHSKNIIDLIKEGDLVNGKEVVTVYGYDEDGNDKDGLGICEVDDDYAYYTYLEDIDIKTIVTKEQFASMEYKVEEEI